MGEEAARLKLAQGVFHPKRRIDLVQYWLSQRKKAGRLKKKTDPSGVAAPRTDAANAWKGIERDYDVSKRGFSRKINFVGDSFRRKIIFRDVAQAYVLAKSGFPKPAVILSGSVVEELLRLYLIHKGVALKANSFDYYIKTCVENKLLKSAIHRLTDSVRHFRNLVHLQQEDSKRWTISKATAIGAVSSIFTIVNDF
jgi:hypothetical protein